jgi:cyclophilin family peptidyl-prolyl cis-trans isomerase
MLEKKGAQYRESGRVMLPGSPEAPMWMRTRSRLGWTAALGAALAAGAAEPARAGSPCIAVPAVANRPIATLNTDFGVIRFELLNGPAETPETVLNFLNYVDRGEYDKMFFHRLAAGFVLQGGGFRYDAVTGYAAVDTDPPIANDYTFCNVRGTVAMAKISGNPDSATAQWFINLIDNTATLSPESPSGNGGFTVFARVVAADMAVVDQIAALHREYGPAMVDDPLRTTWTSLPVKHILARPGNGFGTCISAIDPDPPPTGPTGIQNCPTQAALNAALDVWAQNMDPLVPPELVMVTQVVPEPGAAALIGVGAAALALRRLATRRRVA